ncbi:hypothetical protein [Wenyingzhuangia fucanilytica]|uniref:hypothetical protein n=1 Tax=Wenyingzhuangia fucanilytica TaxID=1790137 RepID=UPI0012F92980|nr:hypothetical protein [Wenyingzhuangia fucanilytica]
MSVTHNKNNTYRIFYVDGGVSTYRCSAKTIEKNFRQNQEIEFYQEEMKLTSKTA